MPSLRFKNMRAKTSYRNLLTLQRVGKLSEMVENGMNKFLKEPICARTYTHKLFERAYTVVIIRVFLCKWHLVNMQFRRLCEGHGGQKAGYLFTARSHFSVH